MLFGIQVGDALRYIHSRGLVHGDVKPGNVFFVGGVAKVGDFSSIVRLVTMTSKQSRMAYTPGFRSPEQVYADLRRKVKELGIESRIDTYLLGNTLLYIMTAESVDGEDAVDPATVDEAVAPVEHEGLRRLIRSMLDPDPLRRPSTEEAVKKLLKIWQPLPLVTTTAQRTPRGDHRLGGADVPTPRPRKFCGAVAARLSWSLW